MKTTVLFRMMVLVAMVVAGIANTELKAQDNNFITNEEKVDDLVVSKVIYRLDGSLYRHMKYDFTYDDQKRVTAKEAFKWDSSTEKWIPYFKIDYAYSSNEITLVYARWNNSHRAYDDSVEKSVYELNDANMPIAYMNYKWNDYKWIEESAGNWAMNIQTPVSRLATCRKITIPGIVKFSFSLKVLTNENGGLPKRGNPPFLLYLSETGAVY